MIKINERYIVDAEGNRVSVILDLDTYQQLLEALEELEDIRAAEAAQADDPKGLPFDQAIAEIEHERATLQKGS
jgi:hypothetical protein